MVDASKSILQHVRVLLVVVKCDIFLTKLLICHFCVAFRHFTRDRPDLAERAKVDANLDQFREEFDF